MKSTEQLLSTLLIKVDNIAEEQKKQVRAHLQLAADFSNFMNEQNVKNSEISSYLESDPKTNQKGIVEQVIINTEEISTIKTEKKVMAAKVSIATAFFVTVGGFILKMLGIMN